ncbi:hypothetical protein COOONC_28548 [Cooperia oncophora]
MQRTTASAQCPGTGTTSASLEELCVILGAAGCNQRPVDTILASWASHTRRQYSSLKKWHTYLTQIGTDLAAANHMIPSTFLASLADKGMSYSSAASSKAAVTTIPDLVFVTTWGKDSVVVRFMEGLFRANPRMARYIINLDENPLLSLRQLTLKLTILLALCFPKRVSEIAPFSLGSLQRNAHRWVFFIDYRNKIPRYGRPLSAVYEAYEDNRLLCPVKTLQQYLAAAEEFRGQENALSLSYASPHRPISAATTVLVEAGVGGDFSAHSTRSADTSKAYKQGVSLEAIMRNNIKETYAASERAAHARRRRSLETREKPSTPRLTVKKSKK